jgi:hypothetical protein
MVIDGGRTGAYPELSDRLDLIAQDGGSLDLYVLTHIDGDHIGGALSYLRDERRPIAPKAVWFNGYRQIKGGGRRSMKQGDDYSSLLQALEWPLNDQFETGVVTVETDPGDIEIAGLRIRILSPYASNLEALGARWDELRKFREQEEELARRDANGRRGARKEKPPIPSPIVIADLIADGETDTELPNGSSIAFIAEWSGRRVLLTGDAHPDVLVRSLGPLAVAESWTAATWRSPPMASSMAIRTRSRSPDSCITGSRAQSPSTSTMRRRGRFRGAQPKRSQDTTTSRTIRTTKRRG